MLNHLILVLARAVQTVDARLPTAVNKRTGVSFGAGLGPHSESETFKLIVDEARAMEPNWFTGAVFGVPYPDSPPNRSSEAPSFGEKLEMLTRPRLVLELIPNPIDQNPWAHWRS